MPKKYGIPYIRVSYFGIEDTAQAEKARMFAERVMKEAEEANDAKSTFLRNMTHELRTSLNSVLGCAAITTSNESVDEILSLRDTIESSGYALLNTIDQILDFTKLKNGKLKLSHHSFKLSGILREIKK